MEKPKQEKGVRRGKLSCFLVIVFAGWIFLSVLNVRTSVQLNLPCSKVQGYECGDFNMK